MQGNQADDFEALARRYWAAWGDMLRTVPAAGMPGMGGPQAGLAGSGAWQQAMDWWGRQATGATPQASDALGHFNQQAGQWYARMQEVAAQFAGQPGSAADVARAWQSALGAAATPPFPDMLRSLGGQGLQGLDPWIQAAAPWLQSARDQGMSWLGMPTFGAGREHQERMQQLAAHLAEYQQASTAYAALMVRSQQDAFPLFEARLAARAEAGRPLDSARALFDLWIDAAEEAYAAIALSPEFSEVYGRLVNAQMRVRGGVQRMVEDASAQFGMPTRSELDGAHRKLAQLEREVRRLRDALGRDGHADDATPAGKAPGEDAPAGAGSARAVRGRQAQGGQAGGTGRGAEDAVPGNAGKPARKTTPGKTGTQPKKGKR